jgi:hypothetical protein
LEDHARQFPSDLPEKALIELMHKYCMKINTGKIIEGARNLVEV